MEDMTKTGRVGTFKKPDLKYHFTWVNGNSGQDDFSFFFKRVNS